MLHSALDRQDDSLSTPSGRLRVKVDLAAPSLGAAGRILLQHPRAWELVPRFLAAGYQVARSMVPLMETALARARDLGPGDRVAAQLVPYLERHIPEEMHGDEPGEAALSDLAAFGVDVARLRASLPAPKIAALVGATYYWILEHHPVAVLGFLELESFHPRQPGVDQLIEASGLPREGFRQLLLHTKLDVAHARELHRVIDGLPLEPYHEELIGLCALQTIGLLSEVLLDVVEEKSMRLPLDARPA